MEIKSREELLTAGAGGGLGKRGLHAGRLQAH